MQSAMAHPVDNIPPELIERRLKNFWGYGSLKAPVWFVGMEEGLSGKGLNELKPRFEATDGKQMVDIRDDMHSVSGHIKWYNPRKPEIQKTLQYPIALLLFLQKKIPYDNVDVSRRKKAIRKYQRHYFGDVHNSMSASLDLLPLPAPNTRQSDWPYDRYGIEGLDDREIYEITHIPRRIKELNKLVASHKPELVIISFKNLSDILGLGDGRCAQSYYLPNVLWQNFYRYIILYHTPRFSS